MSRQVLDQIEKEIQFGTPWKLDDSAVTAVLPILRPNASERTYVLIQEAKERVTISDTGSISRAKAKNNSSHNVFFRKGTLLKGTTQERGVVVGTVIEPNAEKVLEIQCVHASRGIRTGAIFHATEQVAPRKVEQSFMARNDQSVTWSAVRDTAWHLSAMASSDSELGQFSDDLIGTLEQVSQFKEEIEEALKKVPADLADQVGIAVLDIRGVLGVEFFDSPQSWRAFSKSVVRNYADVLTKETTELYSINIDKAKPAVLAFITQLKGAKESLVDESRVSKTYALDGEKSVGEYTSIKGQLIHFIGTRREKQVRRASDTLFTGLGVLGSNTSVQSVPQYWTTTDSPQQPNQWLSYFGRKGSYDILSELNRKDRTWTDLETNVKVSPRTLSKRLIEAHKLNLVKKQPRLQNGKMTYRISDKGKKALAQAEYEYST